MTKTLPFVSVVMAVRNEGPFIARAIERVLAQDYPRERMEIIVADGMSNDDTRRIVAAYCRNHPCVRLIDNPGQIVAAGLNVGVDHARGELILRIDGHGEVATDYVSQVVTLMEEHPEIWRPVGRSCIREPRFWARPRQ